MYWYIKALKKYAVFEGRARRMEFWYFVEVYFIIRIVLRLIDTAVGSYHAASNTGLFDGLFSMAMLMPGIAVTVRRLHDTGRSGWWTLLMLPIGIAFIAIGVDNLTAYGMSESNLVAIVGLVGIIGIVVLFVFMVMDSNSNDNKFGSNPKLDEEADTQFNINLVSANTQFGVGSMYYYGDGVSKDYTKAVRFTQKAAVRGHDKAQFNLGLMYFNGEGVVKDDAEAFKWFQKAAMQGLAEAQTKLGLMYVNGEGVVEDKSEALRWFQKAAMQSHADAQYRLGWMYALGMGVSLDETEAAKWHRKAAMQGHADAQFRLGLMYFNGEGVPQDDAESDKWIGKAAMQGHPGAQFVTTLNQIGPYIF